MVQLTIPEQLVLSVQGSHWDGIREHLKEHVVLTLGFQDIKLCVLIAIAKYDEFICSDISLLLTKSSLSVRFINSLINESCGHKD